ncbi:uncharacterized protein BKA55DRAFT_593422 [Fusarium redolens]|uniref:Heterokaryon incompatibility domain-containing protein n=1 Tax=Fusarium redolens TaxID=48865 RepID=A0A9P9K900_FUSRE|nr:uncharacterized protein BKA55DRAFT_593422 [Fusarium redolens]KAH7253767.1 hypothetical protein BKA55DRAFT_593422 [Fusarium redolens]
MSDLVTSNELPKNKVLEDTSTRDLPPSQEIFATPANEHFLKQYSYHDLNHLQHEIRLVHVFRKPGSDLIHCNFLPPQKLTDISGKYHTISYCAGSAKDTKPILLQGIKFNIFANLYCALRETLTYWSTTNYPQDDCILWIDQICINQHNNSERSHQDYIKGWNSFYDLIESPWWSRAWIRQEFACSQTAIFLYHQEALDLSESSWLQAICHSNLPTISPPRLENDLCGPSAPKGEIKKEVRALINRQYRTLENCHAARFLLLQKSMLGNGVVECNMDFKKLARDALYSRATDPRDKIFSQLGLAHPGYNITPNYSRSNTLSRVLIDTAVNIILFEGNLNILLYALHLVKPPSYQLPSWVPDWTSSTVSHFSGLRELEIVQLPEFAIPIREDATDSIRFGGSPEGGQHTVLFVRALRLGTVEGVILGRPISGGTGLTLRAWHYLRYRIEAERGDEVWLLMGTSCPYVLRPTDKGYRLISEVMASGYFATRRLFEEIRHRMRTGLEVLEEISII